MRISRSLPLVLSFTVCACDFSEVAQPLRDLTVSARALRGLNADVGAGRLDVVGDPELDQIQVEGTVVHAAHHALDDVLDNLVFDLEVIGDTAFLDVFFVRDDFFPEPYVDVLVRLPAGLDLAVRDTSGDLDVRNVASARIDDTSGDLHVRSVGGPLVVLDTSGTLHIEQVKGPLRVEDESGHLSIREVLGDVEVVDTSGDLLVGDVTGEVRIEDTSGDIRVEAVPFRVEIRDGSGDIELRDVPNAAILEDESGEVFRR